MITIIIACSIIAACLGFCLGAVLNYQRGYTDAWDEADAFHDNQDDLANTTWQVTPKGREYLKESGHLAHPEAPGKASSPITNIQ